MSSFKRLGVAEEVRQSATDTSEIMSHGCNCCGKLSIKEKFVKVCSGCESVRYCGVSCQKRHWKNHRILCQAISFLRKSRIARRSVSL